ncbi:MAG: class I SAM-dependent rRNA methyltransferase [Deltaproteobacteria bacterium]
MITLKKHGDRRIRKGHLWVFSNEIAEPPVASLKAGGIYELRDSTGEFLGTVYANPASLISARILSRKKIKIDREFLAERIQAALDRRNCFIRDRDAYRLVFGESDSLPGLIIDRYKDYLVVQTLTAGMDLLCDQIVEVLRGLLEPAGIYVRNDVGVRSLEGLPQVKSLAYGEVPEAVEIHSGGLRFLVDTANGQKTGFYLDQEWNRSLMKHYVVPGARVLDLFCYTGAWALHALAAGAREAVGLDSSRGALKLATENAVLNGMDDRFQTVRDNAVDFLKKAKEQWDVIILDPPAFVKSRARIKEGRAGYIDVNRRALGRIASGGFLVSCSCSHNIDAPTFEGILLAASRQSNRELRILDYRSQGPDHPMLLTMPETRYLKVFVAQVV